MKRTLLANFILTLACAGTVWASGASCGNDCPSGPTKCDCPDQGANPFNPYSGSVHREITDLEMFGGIGEEKLAFRRLTTSRYKPAIPTPFGSGGSWRHNYYWNIYPAGTSGIGGEVIHVDYPDGGEHEFHKETTSSLYLTGVSSTQERIEQSSTDSSQYYLWFPDGKHVAFYKIVSGGVTTFRVQGVYDKHNNFFEFSTDTKNRVTRVTEPGGRFIQIDYGSVGNFPVGTVTFTYTNENAKEVGVGGDFNDWHADSNPMSQQDGVWTANIPLQIGATYQYKFLVYAGGTDTWISDPNNPNTFPEGGPSTGNNSVIKNNDLNTSATSPVPITFSYTSSTATSVVVAGSFNGWSTSASGYALTKNGNTWSVTVSITPGSWQYKFFINGTTWMPDPSNLFTKPDGYGGLNSVLNVGPLDEAITQVQASDGRYVFYNYDAYLVMFSVYSTLLTAAYSDGTAAHYTYSSYNTETTHSGRPTVATADDPRYRGPMTRIAYTYQDNGIEGFISEEKSLVDETVVGHLDPSGDLHRQVTTGPRTINLDFYSGHASSQSDSLQRQKTFAFFDGGWGMLSAVTEHDGSTQYTTSYERTPEFGNVTKVTFPDGRFQTTHYPNPAKPFFPDYTIDENGHRTDYTRDSNGRPTRIDYPDGSYETFQYDNDNFGLVTDHRLRNGYTESFTYHDGENGGIGVPLGLPGDTKTRTIGRNEVTTYSYNPSGLVSRREDGRRNTTTFEYNERGQPLVITFADGNTQIFEYDNYGNRTRVTNELGLSWVYDYDQYNRVSDVTDPLSRVTNYDYEFAFSGGSCSCSVENYPTRITLPSGRKTVITYDTEWQKFSETVGAETSAAATTLFEYDGVGNLKKITDPRTKEWNFQYNERKWKTRATDPNQNYTEWTYDYVGNKKTEKRSGDGNAIQYAYDDSNQLTDVTDQDSHNTHMTRDGAGNMLSLRDARLNTYTFTYDGMNRKKTMVYPDSGGAEQWTYDDAGNLETYTNRDGQVQTFTHDERDRETCFTWSDNAPRRDQTYDAAGRLLTMTSGGSSLSYSYDDANQLTSETQQIDSEAPMTFSYTYDQDGRRSIMAEPTGVDGVTYDYTPRGQIAAISDGIRTGGEFGYMPPILASYTYDTNGNRLTRNVVDQDEHVYAGYTYDNANRLTVLDNKKGTVSFAKSDYAYDTVNARTIRAETIGGSTKTDAYDYDGVDQITQVRYNKSGANQGKLVAYNYDAVGNRSGSNGSSETINGTITNTNYSPNNLNQYTVAGSLSPTYDNNGNLQSQDGWTYEYDAQNRITSAQKGSASVTFAYDGRDRCVSRTINNSTTYLYYDNWNLVEEQTSGNTLVARYVHGAQTDELLRRSNGDGDIYYHQDALGSTVALTDNVGDVIERYTYDVFGAPKIISANNSSLPISAYDNRFLFTGREYLAELQLYDYRNRVYSPGFGRFLQTDPLRFGTVDKNLYRYAANNVTLFTDPDGLKYQSCTNLLQECVEVRIYVIPYSFADLHVCVRRKCKWRCYHGGTDNCYRIPCKDKVCQSQRDHGVEELEYWGPEQGGEHPGAAPLCSERNPASR